MVHFFPIFPNAAAGAINFRIDTLTQPGYDLSDGSQPVRPGETSLGTRRTSIQPLDQPPAARERQGSPLGAAWRLPCNVGVLLLLLSPIGAGASPTTPLLSSFHEKKPPAAEGFAIDLTASEADVLKAVRAVVEDETIHGTYVYEREKTLTDATPATTSSYYGAWTGEGHVFYKVRKDALAPRNFKDSADIGIITVRYIVHGVSAMQTHLQIDAVFVEDGNNRVHESNTSVETSEFAEIQSHLVEIQREEQQAAEVLQKRQLDSEAAAISRERNAEAARLRDAEASVKSLQEQVNQLHHTLEVRVIAPNTELKAAPFRGAGKLDVLPANTNLLVEIITTYWYGVETADGHRGWLRRDQVEPLP